MKIKYVGDLDKVLQKRKSQKSRQIQFSTDEVRDNQSVFNLLNDKDRDILYLIFVSKKKQKAVQKILGRSQVLLVYDIKRIRERIQFIVYLKQVFDIFLNFLETKSDQYDTAMLEILIMMYYTTSLTQTAEALDMPQIYVRYTFERILSKMIKHKHWDVYELFSAINRNKNKIKRTYKPEQINKITSIRA